MSRCIGIVGCRDRNDQQSFEAVVNAFSHIYRVGDYLVSGGCPKGGDRFAEIIARRMGIHINIHRATGASKGEFVRNAFERNTLIAREADILIAVLHPTPGAGKGTADTVRKFQRFNPEGALWIV